MPIKMLMDEQRVQEVACRLQGDHVWTYLHPKSSTHLHCKNCGVDWGDWRAKHSSIRSVQINWDIIDYNTYKLRIERNA